MASKRYKCRSVKRTANGKKTGEVQDRSSTAPKAEKVRIMSDAKAKATLEARLKVELSQKNQRQRVIAASPPKTKPVLSVEPKARDVDTQSQQFARPIVKDRAEKPMVQKGNAESEKPFIAPEPDIVPDLDEDTMQTDSVKEIYHRIHHVTLRQLLYQARQGAKAYDKSYLAAQEKKAELAEKLEEIKATKTPKDANDATKTQYNDKRKALRAQRDEIQKQLAVAIQTAVSLERVCDELEAVAAWKLDDPVVFRKQPRLHEVDASLDDHIKELKALVNAKAGYYAAEHVRASRGAGNQKEPESEPEQKEDSTMEKKAVPEPVVAKEEKTVEQETPKTGGAGGSGGNGGSGRPTGTGGPNGSGKKPGWLSWVIVAIVVLLIIIIVRSCTSGKKQTVVEEKPAVVATAPAKAEAPKPAPAVAEAPKPAPAPKAEEKPAPAPVLKEETKPVPNPYGADVSVATAGDGTVTYTAGDGISVAVAKDGGMKTSYAGIVVTDQKITNFRSTGDGARILTYADGSSVTVDKAGYATVGLGNGMQVAFAKGGMTTSYDGMVVTTSPISSFTAAKDGSRKLGYADGTSVMVDKAGYANVDLGNGMAIAFTQKGTTTAYHGQTVSLSQITSFETGKDGSRKLGYADGTSVTVDKAGYASVDLGNGMAVAFSQKGMTTTYQGQAVSTSAIAQYILGTDGSRKIGYADGSFVAIDKAGYATVGLGNGMQVAFAKGRMTTSYDGIVVTTSPIRSFTAAKDGSRKLGYADGTSVTVDKAGYASVDLGNGMQVAFAKGGMTTSYDGIVVTTSPIRSFTAAKDGSRKLGYADGTSVTVDKAGYASIDLGNGMQVAFAKGGMTTSYDGIVVTTSPISSFTAAKDGSRKLGYADGTSVTVDKAGYASIDLGNGVRIAFTKGGTVTSYGSLVVSDQPITQFSLADGKKSVTYGDGMTASIDKTGFGKVSLPNGITLAFTKDGMVTSFAGQTITEAAVTGYALDAKGAKTLSYENGMQVAVEPNGRTKVSFPNTLTIQINALDDMKSSIAGVTFNDTPIKQFMCEANGDMAALYQSGDVLVIMPEGSVAYALANGLVFASDGTWTGTFYGSTAISESAITGYTRGDDGKQTVTYADGLVLSVEKAGWVTIAVPNGITIATGEKGWNTTYQGMLVTRAAVNGFQTQGDERLLSFEDGMMVYTKGNSIVDVMFSSGAEIAADEHSVRTLYQGAEINTSGISGFTLASDGSKTITYMDGMKAVIDKNGGIGGVQLPDGLALGPAGFTYNGEVITTAAATGYNEADGIRTISFGDGTVVTAGPKEVLVAKKEAAVASAPKKETPVQETEPVAQPETPKEETAVAVVAMEKSVPEKKFLLGFGGYGTYDGSGFQHAGIDLRFGYKVYKGLYLGLESGYGFGFNGGENRIPLLGTVGYAGKNLYGGLLIGAEFASGGTDATLFSLGGYGGVKFDITDNLGMFAEAGVRFGLSGGQLQETRGSVSLGLTYQF